MSGDTRTLTCVECDRTWERARQRGQAPRRCPSCVAKPKPGRVRKVVERGALEALRRAPLPPPAITAGEACRVCGVDDLEPRAQPDLHLACVEQATDKAKKRKAVRRAGEPLAREDVIRRLALERAGLVGKRGRGRPPRGETADRLEEDEDDDADGLTAEECEQIDRINRGPGLSTEGLE